MRTFTVAAVALLSATAAHAQTFDTYAGISAGFGGSAVDKPVTVDINGTAYPRVDIDNRSFFGGAYAGIGYSVFAIEGGLLKLPYYHSSAEGHAPEREGNQTIDGSAIFARLVLRVPPSSGWYVQPYAFLGKARINATSREVVHCGCYPGGEADFKAPLENHGLRPYYGVGAEVPLIGRFSARGELGYIRGGVQSFWTDNRNYYLASVALQVRF